ncbi:E3 ubiquitin/ISG15 ligase TRIM25-like isoform X1 [Micropterus dolomieu]|uniref:E3 ubiquitin/ISG15 ligase TRIM25-like isoform X1 n=1 Tax=Micropterus dolomieu TaxID=147949 RepID=UPI001E8D61BE|nr:E3 ubiquitin/ISG15 ligase TRIM25-like isoform X1 [Micropterus dolomieu]
MAEVDESHFSLLSLEDELTCSICLSTFDCPVTIPCGHNFCQDCLLATWKESYSCPQCRTHFATKPELKKNTVLSTVVQTFNLRSTKSEASPAEEESKAKTEEVIRCDACMEAEASQTCLTCMASFCEEHLRPHRENPNFSLHQLSEPVGDLLERICTVHHKMMEFFCTQHGRPICSLCLQQVHKGCPFMSHEEQRNMKEYDLRDKLGLLDRRIEKTETVMFQMNDTESKLTDAATKRKTALTAVYQQMRDMLAQEEHEAQHEVDRELEINQMKLQHLMKRFTENSEKMRKAREDINSLLSRSQTLAFLQSSINLPKAVNFDPHTPRISLDSKKVTATQGFAAALKEYLTEILKQPVEARLLTLKPGECADEKAAPALGPEHTGNTGYQPKSEQPEPQKQEGQPRSHSPGRPPIQPYFQPVPVPVYMGSHGRWNPSQYAQGHQSPRFPFMAGQWKNPQKVLRKPNQEKKKKTICKPVHEATPKKDGEARKKSHTLKNKEQDKKTPSGQGGNKPSGRGSDFTKKDNPRSHPSSEKSKTHHPHPNKNN